MNVWFCSDLHLGHNGISHKFRRNFESDEQHDMYMLDQWEKTVGKRDIVFCLGDMAFTKERLNDLKSLCGVKRLILGNHEFLHGIKITDLIEVYDTIDGVTKYKGMWLSHAPIHLNELYGKHNVHGHVHRNTLADKSYINVCPEVSKDCQKIFWNLDEIKLLTTDKDHVIVDWSV